MGYKLCMAEKPSVAKDIAKVVGAEKRCNGYYEGNGYRVTWAVGHLVGLAEPEEYGYVSKAEMWGEGRDLAYEQLPIIPDEFKLVILENTREQFEIIKELIHRPDTDYIINCGDMGAEGHILQWFIREMAGCTKKVKRFCATSMTEEAIRHAMNNLRDEEEFANIIKGEFCKKKADWILGMSMSRVESLKYKTNITVGRVQSPTLYYVVKRYLQVENFKITDYYGLDVQLAEGFHVFWKKDVDGIFSEKVKDGENRVLDKAAVQAKCQELGKGVVGFVTNLTEDVKGREAPQLYDITELQRDANIKYGYTAAVTLATAQALYETQKVLSYPRTDSRYITSDLERYMPERIREIGTIEKYKNSADEILSKGLNITSKIVNDKKVTDHHAIIPTEKIRNFNPATMKPTPEEVKKGVTAETMRNILDLVLCRMIVSFSQTHVYMQTSVKVKFTNGMTFSAGGSKVLEMGWMDVQNRLVGKEASDSEETEDKQLFPPLINGQTVTVDNCSLVAKKTTPPKLYTEATLLSSMEKAGSYVVDGQLVKSFGIGTQATRAEIIKKLFDYGYCKTLKKGKTNYIVPTSKGQSIIRVLPSDVYSPNITADWETKIAQIAQGNMTEKQFMDDFIVFIKDKVQYVKEMDAKISFEKERETVGICPWCGGDLWKFEDRDKSSGKVLKIRYYCSDKEQCSFSLDTCNVTVTTRTGKKLTEKQLQKLIAYGFITLNCKSKYNDGKDYKGKFTIIKKEVNGKTYANLEYSSAKSRKGK